MITERFLRGWVIYTSLSDSNCCLKLVSYAAVEEDCAGGLIIEVFDDSDKVGAGVVLLHGCSQSCMSTAPPAAVSSLTPVT